MAQLNTPSRKMSELDIQTAFDRLADDAIAKFNSTGKIKSEATVIALDDQGGIIFFNKIPDTVGQYLFADIPGAPTVPQYAAEFILDGTELRTQLAKEGHPPADIFAVVREAFVTLPPQGTKAQDLTLPSMAPDRLEAVVIELHTREGVFNGFCWIADNPRRCTKGAIQFQTVQSMDVRLPDGSVVKAMSHWSGPPQ